MDSKRKGIQNTGRTRVERMNSIPNTPTLVYYKEHQLSIQHSIVFDAFTMLQSKNKRKQEGSIITLTDIIN